MRGNRKRLTCGYAGNSLAGRGGADGRGLNVVRHIRHDVALGSVSPLPVAPTIGDVGELDGEVVLESHIGVLHINIHRSNRTKRSRRCRHYSKLAYGRFATIPKQLFIVTITKTLIIQACSPEDSPHRFKHNK